MPYSDWRPRRSNKRHSGRTRCSYCGCKFDTTDETWFNNQKTWDHIIPKVLGGKLQLPTCHFCNNGKGKMTLEAWLMSSTFAVRVNAVANADPNASPLHEAVLYQLEEEDAYRLFLETGKRYARN
jgi:hypothetical protein